MMYSIHHMSKPSLALAGASFQLQYLCGDSHFHPSLEFPRKPFVNDLSTSRSAKQRALGSTCNHCLCVHPPAACDSGPLQPGLEVTRSQEIETGASPIASNSSWAA